MDDQGNMKKVVFSLKKLKIEFSLFQRRSLFRAFVEFQLQARLSVSLHPS